MTHADFTTGGMVAANIDTLMAPSSLCDFRCRSRDTGDKSRAVLLKCQNRPQDYTFLRLNLT